MSVRSFALPLRSTVRRRFWNTGTAFLATGRRSRRNGARSLVADFDVSTSGSRSLSAARKLTNVVLACRGAGGNATKVAIERVILARDRPQRLVRVRGQGGEVVAALGDRVHHPGAVDQEPGEHLLVARQLGEQALGGAEPGLRYL